MSTYFDKLASARATSDHSPNFAPVAGLKRRAVAFLNWCVERAAVSALSSMSDHELKDIGLVRSDIRKAVKILPSCD